MLLTARILILKNFSQKYLVEPVILLMMVSTIFICFLFTNLDVVVTFILLAGIWMLDVHMKRVYKFDNITLFADLSFAAFVFSVGRAVSLISVDLNSKFQQDILLNLFVFSFMLLLLWLANLYNCNNIVEVRSDSSKGKKVNTMNLWFGLFQQHLPSFRLRPS